MSNWWNRWINLRTRSFAPSIASAATAEATTPTLPAYADLASEPTATDCISEADAPLLRRLNWSRDADVVAGFQEDTFSLNFPDFTMTRRFEACFRNDLKGAVNDRNHGTFVIEIDGAVVGFLWVAIYANAWTGERYGYINNLYVRTEYRGRHLGKRLMEKAESFFRSKGVRKVRLTVTCGNESAVRLYRQMGYQTMRNEMEKEIE